MLRCMCKCTFSHLVYDDCVYSDDGGVNWVRSWKVTEKDYAYSCLTHVASEDQVGLLWETTAQGCLGPSCRLVFSKITVL